MSVWSDLKKGVEDGFTGKPCRVHGERYPGCPLDHIERARPSPRDNGGWEDYGRPAPLPAPQVDPYAQAMIADLRAENQQCRQLIAEYQEVTAAYAARPEVPAAWQEVVAEQEKIIREQAAQLAQVTETKDRFKASGKRVAAENREMEAFFKLLGERELTRLVHPNAHGGASPERLRLYNDAFVKLAAIYQRIGKK